MASFYSRMVERVFGSEISKRVTAASLSAIKARDDVRDRSLTANTYPRDRHDYDRDEVLRDALEAWRVNPLARRIVELTSQYVVGGGIAVSSKHARTHKFLQEWWKHRLNRLEVRCFDWCDELTRSGELFLVVSTDLAGMSYVRAIPASEIQEIETSENDVEQELIIWEKPRYDGGDIRRSDRPGPQGILSGKPWKVYNELTDHLGENGEFEPVMLHYAVNRPVGAKRGESDLAPLLRWLSRYAAWLEDRARLNRYRNTFIFWVKARFNNQADRLSRQAELNANPPNAGSILVTDETEEWSVLSPKLESHEAGEDGLAIKKMIAAGSANPMHFLAEPEGATRTTAESAGGPTYRHYEQRQLFFLWLIQDLAKVIIRRRKVVDRSVNVEAELDVTGPDISARDNAALATAASVIVASMTTMRDRGLIDDMELLRIVYRFAGEVIDLEDVLKRGQAAPPSVAPVKPAGEVSMTNERVKVDPISGEPKGMAQ
jgi:hypothetical protein